MVSLRTASAAGLAVGLAAAAPAQLKRQSTCYSGVYVIAARGSEEAAGYGKTDQVVEAVLSQIPGSGSVAVTYPASIADPIYSTSVTDGIDDTISLVQDYVNSCGSASNIVLVGFSQGAEVMTDTLAGGVDKPAPLSTDYTQYISAVTVFGDPSFTVGQSFDVGNATESGIFARGGSSLALLNTYASILQSYCDSGDPYCASGDTESVHSNEVPNHASQAEQFIVAQNS